MGATSARCRSARGSTSLVLLLHGDRRPTSICRATSSPTPSSLSWHDLCNDPPAPGNYELQPEPAGRRRGLADADHAAPVDDGDDDPQRRARAGDRGPGRHDRARLRDGQRRRRQPVPPATSRSTGSRTAPAPAPGLDLGAARARQRHGRRDGFPQGPLAAGLYGFKAHYLGDRNVYLAVRRPVRAAARGRREHPDHAANGDEPRRQDAHVHRPRERERRHRRSRTRRTARTISFTIDSGPGTLTPPTRAPPSAARAAARSRSPRPTTGVTTVSAHTTVTGRRRLADARHERHGRQLRPGVEDVGRTRRSRSRRTRRTRSASRTPSPSRCRRTPAPARFVAGGRRARRRHADRLERRGAHARRPAPARTPARTPNATGQCTITFTSPTAGKVTGHATSTLVDRRPAPFTVQTDGTGRTRPTRSRRSSTRTSRSRRRRRRTRSARRTCSRRTST